MKVRPFRPASVPLATTISVLLSLPLFGCIDDTDGVQGLPPTAAAGACEPGRLLAVAGSDYQSSALSFVDRELMTPTASGFLTSGAAVGATGAALSGDVVMATGQPCKAIAVDRTSGVLTSIAPGDGSAPGVGWQLNASGGFYSNVQDVIARVTGELVAVRAQKHPSDALGDDLVDIAMKPPRLSTAHPLSEFASTPGAHAFGGRMAWDGSGLWVPLASVGKAFEKMGEGRVCRAQWPPAGMQITCVAVPGARNCTVARWIPARQQAAVLCSGFFKAKSQVSESALALFAVGGISGGPVLQTTVAALDTATPGGLPRPFFGDVACDATRCWVIALGDGQSKQVDTVWQLDLGEVYGGRAPTTSLLLKGSAPFAISALFFDILRQRLWVADTGHSAGDLRVLSCPATKPCTPLTTVRSNPGGLPAVSIEGI